MTDPTPEDRCPHCGRHGPHACRLNPEPDPQPDDRLFDENAYGRLEDDILADWFGEPRRYPIPTREHPQ